MSEPTSAEILRDYATRLEDRIAAEKRSKLEWMSVAAKAEARAVEAERRLAEVCEEALRMLDITEWDGTPGYESIKAALALVQPTTEGQ